MARAPETHFATITDPKDIGKILRDIDAYNGLVSVRYVLKLIPHFFVRSSELTKAEWSEFDLDNAEWRIPAERMKMRQIPSKGMAACLCLFFRYATRYGNEGLMPGRERGAQNPCGFPVTHMNASNGLKIAQWSIQG